VFTFAWTPLHYLHLMFITLVSTIAVAVVLSKMMGGDVGLRNVE
jgi:SSS family solute:Na+ symporter